MTSADVLAAYAAWMKLPKQEYAEFDNEMAREFARLYAQALTQEEQFRRERAARSAARAKLAAKENP